MDLDTNESHTLSPAGRRFASIAFLLLLIAASAGAIMLGILAFRSSPKARSMTLAICAAAGTLIILLAAPQSIFDRISTITSPGQDVSVQFRLNLWKDSLSLVKRSPIFGAGVGTYEAAIPSYRTDLDETRAEHAESDWMEHSCEASLAGLIVLAGFIAAVARGSLKRLSNEELISRTRGVLTGASAAVFALLAYSIFDFNTRIPSNAPLLATLLGMLTGAHIRKKQYATQSVALRLIPAVLILSLSMTATWRSAAIGLSRHAAWHVDPTLANPEELAQVAAQKSKAQELVASDPQIPFKCGVLYNEETNRSADAELYRDIRFNQAKSSFQRAVQLAPSRGRHWFELAWTEGNLRNDVTADSLFIYATSLEPTWSRLRVNYALHLASRDRIEEAMTQLEVRRNLKPGLSA